MDFLIFSNPGDLLLIGLAPLAVVLVLLLAVIFGGGR